MNNNRTNSQMGEFIKVIANDIGKDFDHAVLYVGLLHCRACWSPVLMALTNSTFKLIIEVNDVPICSTEFSIYSEEDVKIAVAYLKEHSATGHFGRGPICEKLFSDQFTKLKECSQAKSDE